MKIKLHIAVICDSIDTTLGGSYISAQRFAKGLADQGHHIVWCTSRFLEDTKRKEFGYARVYEFPSIFPIGPQHVRFAYPRVSQLIDIFKKENIDIIYNIHPSYIGRQAYRAAKKTGLPIISHSHIYAQLLIPGLPAFLQKMIKNSIARFYKKCDGVIYPTIFAKKDFEAYHFDNKEMVISNGVNTDIFHPGETPHPNVFNIVYVGRLDQEKNIALLIKALHILKQQNLLAAKLQCTLVGGGSEEKKLRTLVTSYGLGHVVHFTGKLVSASPAIVQAYQNASVYVLTSLYELESMTTLEAMACGCPLLIARSTHSAAVHFVQNNGYLFDPHDPKDLADKIYTLFKNPDILETLQEKSIQSTVMYSFEKSIKKLESFFLGCIEK